MENANSGIAVQPLIEFVRSQPSPGSWKNLFGSKKQSKVVRSTSSYVLYTDAAYIKSQSVKRSGVKLSEIKPYERKRHPEKKKVKKRVLNMTAAEKHKMCMKIITKNQRDRKGGERLVEVKSGSENKQYLRNRTLLGKMKQSRRADPKWLGVNKTDLATRLTTIRKLHQDVKLLQQKRGFMFGNKTVNPPKKKEEEMDGKIIKSSTENNLREIMEVKEEKLERSRRSSVSIMKKKDKMKLVVENKEFKVSAGSDVPKEETADLKVDDTMESIQEIKQSTKEKKKETELGEVKLQKLHIEGNDISLKEYEKGYEKMLDSLERISSEHLKILIKNLVVEQKLKDNQKEWVNIIYTICLNAVNMIHIDTRNGDKMDIRNFIKIKKIPGGEPKDSSLFKGVVFANSLVNKKMDTSYKDPKVLLVNSALQYKDGAGKYLLDDVLKRETAFLNQLIKNILTKKPNLILLGKHCNGYAQRLLTEKGVSIMVNVKKQNLQRIERCNKIPLLTGFNEMNKPLSRCEKTFLKTFYLDKKKEKMKTLFFIKSTIPSRGFTILLRGGEIAELKIVKKVLNFALFAAMNLKFESEFFFNQGGIYPEDTDLKLKDNHTISTSPTVQFPIPTGLTNPIINKKNLLSVIHHQHFISMLTHEYVKPIEHSEYVDPVILPIAYYSGNDMTIGRYIEKCFSMPFFDKKRLFIHGGGKIVIECKEQPENFFESSIFTWNYCKKCKKYVVPVRRAERCLYNFSFGKFLENTYYNKALTCDGCGHSVHHDHVRFFGFESLIVSFEYKDIEVSNIITPGKYLEYETESFPEYLEKLKTELKFEVEKFLKDCIKFRGPESKTIGELNQYRTDWVDLINSISDLQKYDKIVLKLNGILESGSFEDVLQSSRSLQKKSEVNSKSVFGKVFKIFTKEPSPNAKKVVANKNTIDNSRKYIKVVLKVNSDENMIERTAHPILCNMSEVKHKAKTKEVEKKEHVKPPGTIVHVPKLLDVFSFSDNSVVIYKNEPTSIISFALKSKERNKFKLEEETSYQLLEGIIKTHDENPHFNFERNMENKKQGFHCTSYFEKEFIALRKIYFGAEKIKNTNDERYIDSLRHCKEWIPSGGKSKATFVKTWDDRFVLKKFSKLELYSFLETAEDYFQYASNAIFRNLPTSLAKIFGIYKLRYYIKGRFIKEDFVVMENLFYNRKISLAYDLKGSLRNRFQRDRTKTLWDENILDEVYKGRGLITTESCKELLDTSVHNDSLFLSKLNIMDYSLLVGIDETKKEYVVGIIDTFRQYTWDKQFETWIKSVSSILVSDAPTVISPKYYKNRFRKAIDRYFILNPSKYSGMIGSELNI